VGRPPGSFVGLRRRTVAPERIVTSLIRTVGPPGSGRSSPTLTSFAPRIATSEISTLGLAQRRVSAGAESLAEGDRLGVVECGLDPERP
jgi:hypothetical protein